jgi:hypothetical protein
MEFYDANGKLLQEKQTQLNAGVNTLQWNISNLPKGVYLLQSKNSIIPVIKIVKQ